MDTTKNGKVDQSRWLNTGGSRWALDTNEDGRIDSWKLISPEEVSQVAVRALVRQDASLLTSLLVTEEDLKQLGVAADVSKKILDGISAPAAHLRKIATNNGGTITPQTKWLQFNGSSPSVIPAEQVGTRADLIVYENTMAVIDTGAGKGGLVQIGEMVHIGNIWKLASLPVPQGSATQVVVTGLLMQAGAGNPAGGVPINPGSKVPAAVQKLIEQLQALDTKDPGPEAGREANAKFYQARLALLEQLVAASSGNADEEAMWIRQITEFLTAGVQNNAYTDGIEILRQWDAKIKQARPNSALAVNVSYHRLLADYVLEMKQATGAESKKTKERWMKQFEEFIGANAATDEAADAAFRIAGIYEFDGEQEQARKWYDLLVSKYSQTDSGKRAVGAQRRLNLPGKVLELTGPGLNAEPISLRNYRGRYVLVIFWSTWCDPCTKELPQVLALYNQYRKNGFEILGVNVDDKPEPIGPYIEKFGMTWPSIHQPKGLEGPIAREFGIISLPTMFFVGPDGKVINRHAQITYVQDALKKAFGKNINAK
jgi:thiol-disulfide isomerase/thioredoxin